jgi:Transposase DDE domain
MKTEEGKAIYRQRSQIAEFPHAWIKERCGLRQFRCRGQEKTSMEATWTEEASLDAEGLKGRNNHHWLRHTKRFGWWFFFLLTL